MLPSRRAVDAGLSMARPIPAGTDAVLVLPEEVRRFVTGNSFASSWQPCTERAQGSHAGTLNNRVGPDSEGADAAAHD